MSHDTCDCCSTSIGWIWNPEAETAEPCPVCGGDPEITIVTGSTAWDSNGSEPIEHTSECTACAGSGAFAAWAAGAS